MLVQLLWPPIQQFSQSNPTFDSSWHEWLQMRFILVNDFSEHLSIIARSK
jgi:hypothetical protein